MCLYLKAFIMDTNKILQSGYLDILFDGRNKQYGGYELRIHYPRRLKRALFVLAGTVVIATSYIVFAGNEPESGQALAMIREHTLTPPPIKPDRQLPELPKTQPAAVKPTVKITPPAVVKNNEVDETERPPEISDLKNVAIGLNTANGDPNGIDAGIISNNPGTGVIEAPTPPEVAIYVEQMPKAPYDINKYLGEHIRYPVAARENNISGKVNIQFVVNEDGSITDVKVVGNRRVGGGLEEEAMRVVSAMPGWKPGRQNGIPVKVYFTLPVSFVLE